MFQTPETVFNYTNSGGVSYYKNFIKTQKILTKIDRDYSSFTFDLLNEEQKFAYNLVKFHVESLHHDPIKLILHGVAGVGKSFLILALKNLLRDKCRILAPTGSAANNIMGETIHSALELPFNISEIPFDNNDPDFEPTLSDIAELDKEIEFLKSLLQLSHNPSSHWDNINILIKKRNDLLSKLNNIHARFADKLEGVNLILIDEYSMVGCRMLAHIERRLKQIKQNNDPMGSLSVILAGDIAQLPPIGDSPVYSDSNTLKGFAQIGAKIYRSFDTCINLKQQQRQDCSSQQEFRELLLRLRAGKPNDEDILHLNMRCINNFDQTHVETFEDAIRLFPGNLEVDVYNKQKLVALGKPIVRIFSKESDPGIKNHHVLELCIGSRVMLLQNLATAFGLVNGAIGTVVDIVYEAHDETRAAFIMVNFDNYSGPSPLSSTRAVPIPETKFWHPQKKAGEGRGWWRTRFALRLAWASTIHKVQGLTLRKVVIDIKGYNKFFKHILFTLFFVAISRCKKLDDILIMHNLDKSVLTHIQNYSIDRRFLEEERIEQLSQQTQLLWL